MITQPTITPLLVADLLAEGERLVSDADRKRLVVEDEGIGLPAVAKTLVAVEAGLELRRPVDLAGDQHRAVEQKRRPPLLDDLETRAFESRAARRGKLGGIEAREPEPASGLEIGVDQDREVPATELPRHTPSL